VLDKGDELDSLAKMPQPERRAIFFRRSARLILSEFYKIEFLKARMAKSASQNAPHTKAIAAASIAISPSHSIACRIFE
jgi:hypothetical protein